MVLALCGKVASQETCAAGRGVDKSGRPCPKARRLCTRGGVLGRQALGGRLIALKPGLVFKNLNARELGFC